MGSRRIKYLLSILIFFYYKFESSISLSILARLCSMLQFDFSTVFRAVIDEDIFQGRARSLYLQHLQSFGELIAHPERGFSLNTFLFFSFFFHFLLLLSYFYHLSRGIIRCFVSIETSSFSIHCKNKRLKRNKEISQMICI